MHDSPDIPIGQRLRTRRTEVLKKGLRQMAAILGVAPAHVVDVEKGNRRPSEDLMIRIAAAYEIPEAELRAGWSRAHAIVDEVASQDVTTVEKVPEFLRTARDLTPEQWDALIAHARDMAKPAPTKKRKKKRGSS